MSDNLQEAIEKSKIYCGKMINLIEPYFVFWDHQYYFRRL